MKYRTDKLAFARDAQGFSDTQIAHAIRRHVSVVGRTIKGHPQYQSPKTVKAIADFLRVPMVELVSDAAVGGRGVGR